MGKKKVTLRVVCDTNVVVSALLFGSGRLAWLREAWRSGVFVPLLSEATTRELLAVLAYPKFRLSAEELEALLAGYLPHCQTVHPLLRPPEAPLCRDPHDQPFVDLAMAGHADYLVTGDLDLLELAGRLSCPVVTPAAFQPLVEELGSRP